MLLNFFLQKTILSVRLYLINAKPCRRTGRFPFSFRPRVRVRKPNSLALPAPRREPRRRLGRLFAFFRPGVRARKPSLLALQAGGREPRRRTGLFFFSFRARVRARKPNSLALQAAVREPLRAPGPFFAFFRHRVRAQKPNSLALPAPRREPCRHTDRQGQPPAPQKRKAAISKSKSLLPLFWGLIDRIHFLYGFIPYETPSAMLSSCEGSLPGSHMRTGTVLPFP